MILLPRFVDIELHGYARAGVAGRYKLRKGKDRGYIDAASGLWIPGPAVVTGQLPFFGNLITDLGLNALGADVPMSQIADHAHVGEGTTAAANGDTTLESWLASTSAFGAGGTVVEAQESAPYYGVYTQTRRFAEGAAEGNISEVGMARESSNTNMYSRARVVDGGGTPTTFAVDSDEWLDLIYQHRLYPDHILANGGNDDGTGTIAWGGINYDYVIRPALVTNANYLDASDCRGRGAFLPGSLYQERVGGTGSVLGAADETPSPSQLDNAVLSFSTYSTDSFTMDTTWSFGLTDANVSGGVVTLLISTGQGAYQLSFDLSSGSGGVPKDGTKVASYTHTIAWGRASIP
jgi:hypothetical protein